jgi:UDP-GlcNAc:undecaprenyl-phosphate/decaprenyl-phosphate GlcNAc-1-phosphate transferase
MGLILIGFAAGLVSWWLTPYLRDFFLFLQVVDEPDAGRRVHSRPIPRIGGIAIALAYAAPLLIALSVSPRGMFGGWPTAQIRSLLPGVLVITLTGLIDDLFGIRPWHKLAGQATAAALVVWGGIRMTPWPVPYAEWIMPLAAIAWLMFCSNAFNLIDGLDGLASGVTLIASASLLAISLIHGDRGLALAAVALLGAVTGFLRHNFSPATVFLGDCGSLLLGFLIGCFALLWNSHAGPGLSRYAGFFAALLPSVEVAISIARRLLRSRGIFAADRNHIHHRLLSKGLPPAAATLRLYAVALVAGLFGVCTTVVDTRTAAILLGVLLPVGYTAARSLSYEEFSVLHRWLFRGEMLRSLRLNIFLEDYRRKLSVSRTLEERWTALSEAASSANLDSVELVTPHGSFRTPPNTGALQPRDAVRLSLRQGGSLRVEYRRDRPDLWLWIAPLAVYLDQSLELRQHEETPRAQAHRAGLLN